MQRHAARKAPRARRLQAPDHARRIARGRIVGGDGIDERCPRQLAGTAGGPLLEAAAMPSHSGSTSRASASAEATGTCAAYAESTYRV